jgi:2-dehydro-3-deoxygalactonokinase
MSPTLIGIDWGTSTRRGWAFGVDGAVLASGALPRGISTVADGGFAAVLRELAGAWTDGSVPIVLGGMIGSRQGWQEVPYLPCPASPDALAAGAQPIDTGIGPGWIVPGLSCQGPFGIADVMRGEEVQLLGAGIDAGVVLLPGTHGKWVRLEGGAATRFRTFMTGELFALLRTQSLLGRLMEPGGPDEAAFDAGVDRALDDPALTALLFSVRTEGLFGRIAPTALADYLSGLLIGAEVAAGLRDTGEVTAIIAEGTLAARYARALGRAGATVPRLVSGDEAASAGLLRIGRAIGEGRA